MGAFAALGVGIHVNGPGWLVLILMALAALVAGSLWILVPALARAYWDVNEIITTLLLNFVAAQLVTWASLGFWRDTEAAVIQSTKRVPYRLAELPGTDSLTIALLVPFVIAAVLFWIFRSTTIGFEIDTIGGNPRAAAFAGINVRRRILLVMLCTGAIAGLGGMLQLSAPGARQLGPGYEAQFGLTGFIVAALAGGIRSAVWTNRLHRCGPCRRGNDGRVSWWNFHCLDVLCWACASDQRPIRLHHLWHIWPDSHRGRVRRNSC